MAWESAVEPEPSPPWGFRLVVDTVGPSTCWRWVDKDRLASIAEEPRQVPESIALAGQPATRTDWVGGDGYYMSEYAVVSPHGWKYELECTAFTEHLIPRDRWLSIAEIIEFISEK